MNELNKRPVSLYNCSFSGIRLSIVVVLLLFPFLIFASNNQAHRDSLIDNLVTANGWERVKILNELPRLVIYDKPAAALEYTQEAMRLSLQLKDKGNIAAAHHNFGRYYFFQGQEDSAVSHHRHALLLRRQLPDSVDVARSLNGLGALYDKVGNQDSALAFYFGALDILNALQADQKLKGSADTDAFSTTISNIAVCYFAQGKTDLSIQYLKRGLKIDEARGVQEDIAFDLSNIGSIYNTIAEYDSATVYHKRALAIRRALNNKSEMARSLQGLALVYQRTGQQDEAARNMREALDIKRGVGIPYEMSLGLYLLADIYNDMGRFNEARDLAAESRLIADTLKAASLQRRIYQILSVSQAGMGEFEKAYATNLAYQNIHDSLRNQERDAKFAKLSSKYETEDRKKRISELENINTRNELETVKLRNQFYSVVSGLVIVVLLALLILSAFLFSRRNSRRLRELNRKLEESHALIAEKTMKLREQSGLLEKKNLERAQINTKLEKMVQERTKNLQRANRELDLFLYQSSHALRGPLMRIMGLFSIIRTEADPKVLRVMNEKVDYTIKTMDRMLHKLMDVTEIQRRTLHPEPLAILPVLEGHIEEIEREMNYAPATFELNVPEEMLTIPEKYILNVVFRNLLENAMHFRVPGRQHTVKFNVKLERNNLYISVRDNGMGIPKEHLDSVFSMFFRGTEKSPGMGLGLYVMKKAVDLLGGETEIYSQEQEFTEVKVRIPVSGIVSPGSSAREELVPETVI